jgi:hypothetical protein
VPLNDDERVIDVDQDQLGHRVALLNSPSRVADIMGNARNSIDILGAMLHEAGVGYLQPIRVASDVLEPMKVGQFDKRALPLDVGRKALEQPPLHPLRRSTDRGSLEHSKDRQRRSSRRDRARAPA